MEELLKLLGFSTPLIYAGAAYGFFHWLDENASDDAKAALAQTMRFKDYKDEQVASASVEIFDRIYTYPLLRWRAFFRSLIFTTVVSAISIFEGLLLFRYVSVLLLLLGFGINILTDYVSLFAIRALLIRSGAKPVIGLALGTISGAAIVFAADLLRRIAFVVASFIPDFHFSAFPAIIFLVWHEPWLSTYAFPAFAVFVWLPLFALGIVIVRIVTPLSWIVGRTQWFLKEGKEHPLKAIGYVAAVVVFLVTVAGRAVFRV